MRYLLDYSIVIFSILFCFGLLFLFPLVGFGAFVNLPLIIFINFCLGIISLKLSKRITNGYYKIFVYALTLSITIYITLIMFPSSVNRYPIQEIQKATKVWQDYDDVIYEDIFENGDGYYHSNVPLRIAALMKFNRELPDRAILVGYYNLNHSQPIKTYFLQLKSGEFNSNNKGLIFYKDDDWIYELYQGDTIKYKNPIKVGNNQFGVRSGEYEVFFNEVILDAPKGGFDLLFYKLLGLK